MPRFNHKATENAERRFSKFEKAYQKARAKKAARVDAETQIDLFDNAPAEYVQRDTLRMAQITTRNRRRVARMNLLNKNGRKGAV